jgi:hypothetical protein
LLSIGIFGGRSKFYGFYAFSVFIVFFFSDTRRFRWNFRNILLIICMLAAVIAVAWGKIYFYFHQALSDVDEDMIARFVLYRTTPEILYDYFPFGSGLASYATFFSGEYYSDIYMKYSIDNVFGISKSFHDFIADTYYPSLAQFGVVGIILYLLFWIYILKKALRLHTHLSRPQAFTVVILIVGFLAIEGTSAPTFIAQGGFFVMMLMGLILSERADTSLETTPAPTDKSEV